MSKHRKMTVKELRKILAKYPDEAVLSAYYSLYIGNTEISLLVKKD